MIKVPRFLHVFAFLFITLFVGNAFAAGYTCDTYKKYTSCVAGRALSGITAGNSCNECGSNATSASGNTTTSCYCSNGYWAGSGTISSGCTPTASSYTGTCATVAPGTACSVAKKTCGTGQYLSAAGNCTDCEKGYYCPNASTYEYTPNGSVQGRTQCMTNRTTSSTKSTSYSSCYITCDAGKYVASSTATSCTDAPAGSFRAGQKTYYQTSSTASQYGGQTSCAAGSHSAAGASGCIGCTSGYMSSAGTSTATGCTACTTITGRYSWSETKWNTDNTVSNVCTVNQCAVGYYKSGNTCPACSALTGVSVANGAYTSALGSTANTACKYTAPAKTITGCTSVTSNQVTYGSNGWPTSTYKVTANAGHIISNNDTANATCTACIAGEYREGDGSTATACDTCPTDYDDGGTGVTLRTNCKISCAAGTRVGTANDICRTSTGYGCALHTVNAGSISSSSYCTACNNAATDCTSYTRGAGTTNSASACPLTVVATGVPGGKYVSSNGTTSANCSSDCAAGYYGAAGNLRTSNSCDGKCATGSHSADGASGCIFCTAGTTTSGTGTKTSTGCTVSCGIDGVYSWTTPSWSANTVSNLCTVNTCVAGRYKSGNTCPQCLNNTYSSAGATLCASCNDGYSISGTNVDDHNSSTDCKIYCDPNTTVATAGKKCTSCAAGTGNSGNTVTQGDTGPTCSVLSYTCVAGEYLPAGETSCDTCKAGHFCPGGTPYNYSATQNQGMTECVKGSHSGDGASACTPCAGGVTTPGTATKSTNGCSVNCGNITGLDAWKQPGWSSNNTVSDLCKLDYCLTGRYKSGETCPECSNKPTAATYTGTADSNACPWSLTCSAGKYFVHNTDEKLRACSSECVDGKYCEGVTAYRSSTTNLGLSDCPANYDDGGTKLTKQADCKWQTTAGTYVKNARATTATPCDAGYACPSALISYGETGEITQCTNNTYSTGSAEMCTGCLTGYSISGTTAADHNELADCKKECDSGTYLATKNDPSCTDVGNGYWAAKTSNISQGTTSARTPCDADDARNRIIGSDSGRGSRASCYSVCPTPKDLLNKILEVVGTATTVNLKEYFIEATSEYPVCTYTASCLSTYSAYGQNTENPQCLFSTECPPNHYCSPDPIPCPSDGKNAGKNNAGDTSIYDCYVTTKYSNYPNGEGESTCYYTSGADGSALYNTSCQITPKSCEAGYYHLNGNACSPVEDGFFSPAGNINQNQCPKLNNNTIPASGSDDGSDSGITERDSATDCYYSCAINVAHSTSVTAAQNKVYFNNIDYPACSFQVICDNGYHIAGNSNNTANPICDANQYTIMLNKNGGAGSVDLSRDCVFDSGSCQLPENNALTQDGYTSAGYWCSDAGGGLPCYTAGSVVTTNISPNGTAHTLFAKWTPRVYTVTLDHQSASQAGAPETFYLKYANDWYSDAGAATTLSALTTKPTRGGYAFVGYYTAPNAGGVQVVDSNGNFIKSTDVLTMTTSSPAKIYAAWSVGTTHCDAGQYYTGTGTDCAKCLENNYCPDGDYTTDTGKAAGLVPCPNGGASAEGADSAGKCYKPGLQYNATHGSGTQRCFHTSGSGTNAIYDTNCDYKVIQYCNIGHYYDSGVDCTEVGAGYYSAADDKTRESCPNGGTTTTTISGVIQECYKIGLDYTAANGAGTQRCFYSSGAGSTAKYENSCDTKRISTCKEGYWRENANDSDCAPAGYNYYSLATTVMREPCPNSGLTSINNAAAAGQCYKPGLPYIATYGSGTKLCFYNVTGDSYDTNCGTITITYCSAGYYRETVNSEDCSEAGIGFYSPIADIANYPCENGGITVGTTSSGASECFLERVSCAIANGLGEHKCYYSSGVGATADYAANCTSCLVTGCAGGFSQVGNTCVFCSENHFCGGGTQENCGSVGDGTYVYSDAGTTSSSGCYKACALGMNSATMKGRDYYIGADTCEIATCAERYELDGGVCKTCAAGSFCDGTGGGTGGGKSCASLGDGSWEFSAAGAASQNDCYRTCPEYAITYGTAVPDSLTEYYPDACTYSCKSITGNTGVIIGGACLEQSCSNTYEMVGGVCKPCDRDKALSYNTSGNCEIASCVAGYHPNGQSCEGNVIECLAPNADEATQTWNAAKKAFGICTIKTCAPGYHVSSNACVIDEQECVVENGTGYKEWDSAKNRWGDCVVTYCKPGYSFDPSETNELTKPCGQCKNKFSVLGELAVSSYTAGCDIAACMYQGEMYNLEGGECVPICDVNGYEDETGTMKWNSGSKKCVRQCKEGFTAW
ncbi:MAG: hypothetical protein LBJ73_03430 [Rickettsiales bacterium]|nr:hypothetical protein [Rickettsiales bacterium]